MIKGDKYSGKAWFDVIGVKSDVISHSSVRNDDKQVIGHICMLDIEDHRLQDVKNMCERMFDVAFVFESSKTGYHVYNPVIRSFEDTKELMESIYLEDVQHVSIGAKRGDWVLRISDKPAASKKIPELVHSVLKPSKRKTYSYPHLLFLKDYYNVELADSCINKLPTDGKTIESVKYRTFK